MARVGRRDSRSRDFSADDDGRFGLTRHNTILILLLDLLQVLPESIKISTVFLDELFASNSRFFHDGVFPHAITLPSVLPALKRTAVRNRLFDRSGLTRGRMAAFAR